MKVGFVPAVHPRQLLSARVIRAFEELGADSLWAPGHIATDRPVPEVMTSLCWLAAHAEQAIVGSAVLLAPLYHPVIVAKQLAELDRATGGGRIRLGIGVGGEYPSEFSACQVPVAERGPRTDEAITIVKRLWQGGPVDHDGRFWPFEGVAIEPPPTTSGGPPVVVAGRKEPAMRRAGSLGDGWMPFLFSPEQYASSVERVRAHATAAGRTLDDDFEWYCFLYVSVDDDGDAARRRAAEFIGARQAGDAARFATVIDRVAVAGTPDDVAARLQAFADAGARHLVIVPCEREDPIGAARRIIELVPSQPVASPAK